MVWKLCNGKWIVSETRMEENSHTARMRLLAQDQTIPILSAFGPLQPALALAKAAVWNNIHPGRALQ